MKFIAHRGNVFGPNVELENSPNYIDKAISTGYDVEVDLWVKDDKFLIMLTMFINDSFWFG